MDPENQRRRGFAALAVVLVIVVMGGLLPSPLYVIYAARLGLSSLQLTVLFAVYAIGVLAVLVSVGHLSDHVGRRRIVAASVAVGAASDLAFLVSADDFGGLLAGRLLSGASIGLLSGAVAAHLVELSPPGRTARGARASGIGTVAGGGAGAILGGAIAQWAGDPTVATYVVHLALLALAAALLALVPETVAQRRRSWPRLPRLAVERHALAVFVPASLAAFCAFAMIGLANALTGTFLRALGHPSHLLTGATTGGMAVLAAVAPLVSRARPPVAAVRIGLAGLLPALALLVAAIAAAALVPFLVAMALAGATFGVAFEGALRRLQHVSALRRGELFSAFYTVAYAGMALPVVGVGLLADYASLTVTVAVFAGAIASIAAGTLVASREPAAGHPGRASAETSRSAR